MVSQRDIDNFDNDKRFFYHKVVKKERILNFDSSPQLNELLKYRARYYRGRVSNLNQSEARKTVFLDSDWSKLETLARLYRTL